MERKFSLRRVGFGLQYLKRPLEQTPRANTLPVECLVVVIHLCGSLDWCPLELILPRPNPRHREQLWNKEAEKQRRRFYFGLGNLRELSQRTNYHQNLSVVWRCAVTVPSVTLRCPSLDRESSQSTQPFIQIICTRIKIN